MTEPNGDRTIGEVSSLWGRAGGIWGEPTPAAIGNSINEDSSRGCFEGRVRLWPREWVTHSGAGRPRRR